MKNAACWFVVLTAILIVDGVTFGVGYWRGQSESSPKVAALEARVETLEKSLAETKTTLVARWPLDGSPPEILTKAEALQQDTARLGSRIAALEARPQCQCQCPCCRPRPIPYLP